jgi:hypothetical protein
LRDAIQVRARGELEEGDDLPAVEGQERAWKVHNPKRARAHRSRLLAWDKTVEAQVKNPSARMDDVFERAC